MAVNSVSDFFLASSHVCKVLSVPFSLYRTFIIIIFFINCSYIYSTMLSLSSFLSLFVHRFTLPCVHCHHFFHCSYIYSTMQHAFTVIISFIVHIFTLPCFHCHHFFHCLFTDLLYHAFTVIISFIVCSQIYSTMLSLSSFLSLFVHRFTLPCFHCHHFFHCLFTDLLYHAFTVIISSLFTDLLYHAFTVIISSLFIYLLYHAACFHCHHFFHCSYIYSTMLSLSSFLSLFVHRFTLP